MRTARHLTTLALLALLVPAGGCFDVFSGARIEAYFSQVTPPCKVAEDPRLGGLGLQRCQQHTDLHYEMFGVLMGSSIARLAIFTASPMVDLAEQLSLEREGAILSTGIPFTIRPNGPRWDQLSGPEQDLIASKMRPLEAVYAVSSHAPRRYQPGGKTLEAGYWVGNYRFLTQPHNGQYFGTVAGIDPVSNLPIGGASFNTPLRLAELDSVFVTIERDSERTSAGPTGPVYLQGLARPGARGVLQVELTSEHSVSVRGLLGIYPDL